MSDSESDTSSDSGMGLQGNTEIKQLFESVKIVITSLFRLSMSIRDPAPNTQSRSTMNVDKSIYEPHDILHAQAKYPSSPEFLTERLGRAISARRQYLTYREEHHNKLGKNVEKLGIEDSHTEHTTNSTEATPMPGVVSQNSQNVLEEDDSASQTSFATSINATIRVPSLPKESQGQDFFECPLCFMIVSIHSKSAWKQHVYRDLHPYCCTFEHCATADRLYESRHEWFQHELEAHRMSWECIEGCSKMFDGLADFEKHVKKDHPSISSMIDTIRLSSGRAPSLSKVVDCSLCQKTTSLSDLQKHLASHQQPLALFALPPNLDETEDGEDAENAEDSEDEEASDDVEDYDAIYEEGIDENLPSEVDAFAISTLIHHLRGLQFKYSSTVRQYETLSSSQRFIVSLDTSFRQPASLTRQLDGIERSLADAQSGRIQFSTELSKNMDSLTKDIENLTELMRRHSVPTEPIEAVIPDEFHRLDASEDDAENLDSETLTRRMTPSKETFAGVQPENDTTDTPGLTVSATQLSPSQQKHEESENKVQFEHENAEENLATVPAVPLEQDLVKGILRKPTRIFPEDPEPVREGVAPLKSALNPEDIPIGARWTRIDRRFVNPEALEEAKERFEERLDCVIVLRVLTQQEIQKLADRTQEIRLDRESELEDFKDISVDPASNTTGVTTDVLVPETMIQRVPKDEERKILLDIADAGAEQISQQDTMHSAGQEERRIHSDKEQPSGQSESSFSSDGDSILIREMDPNRPDIARQVSQNAFNANLDSVPETDSDATSRDRAFDVHKEVGARTELAMPERDQEHRVFNRIDEEADVGRDHSSAIRHPPPRSEIDTLEGGYSYTDPTAMYRDTEPKWRRSRDVSVDLREQGPPPSTRGFDKINSLTSEPEGGVFRGESDHNISSQDILDPKAPQPKFQVGDFVSMSDIKSWKPLTSVYQIQFRRHHVLSKRYEYTLINPDSGGLYRNGWWVGEENLRK